MRSNGVFGYDMLYKIKEPLKGPNSINFNLNYEANEVGLEDDRRCSSDRDSAAKAFGANFFTRSLRIKRLSMVSPPIRTSLPYNECSIH